MKITKKDIASARSILDTQFAGYDYDKVLCILNVLIVEEIKKLRCRLDDLQSSVDNLDVW